MPLPILRPRVTAAAVGHLVKAGLLIYLGGDTQFPDVHPDQAAVRLGVRRMDFDAVVKLGFLYPVGSVDVDYRRQGGVTTVPLYAAQDVVLLPVVRPLVDWRAVRTVAAGRRSPLAALDPVAPGGDRVFLAEVARMARVGRAAVVNWRRRQDDFPDPVAGTDVRRMGPEVSTPQQADPGPVTNHIRPSPWPDPGGYGLRDGGTRRGRRP
ncbi:hypothetical protein [Streptomyces sp. NPDC002209]|uniref:hypothetical protein n=1 Tax=Streptomyces sp. NPDC002209 TaxID=3364638 RepID=UPI0036B27481